LSEKAFWVNVEEDRLVSPDLIEGLSAKFSSKPVSKKIKEGSSDKPSSKKLRELKGGNFLKCYMSFSSLRTQNQT